jgi:ATP-dependent Clp protease, protease subunit
VAGHVFISYSRDDRDYVRRLAGLLVDSGVPVWIDDDIDYGEAWVHVICEKIDSCSAFVPVMTPSSWASTWVAREIARAEVARRQILPVLLDGPVFFTLRHLQCEDATGGRLPTGRFVRRLSSLSSLPDETVFDQSAAPSTSPPAMLPAAEYTGVMQGGDLGMPGLGNKMTQDTVTRRLDRICHNVFDEPPLEVSTLQADPGSSPDDSIYNRLLRERIVVLGSEVTKQVADRICAQLLLLAAEDPERDIKLWINSPGGSVYAGMAIYDTMQFLGNDVATCAMGMAAGMAQLLLCAGTKGKRYALQHARILMLRPSAGTAADVATQADSMLQTKRMLLERIAYHTGQTQAQIDADSEPERWFTAQEARDYGLIDRVVPATTFQRPA